MNEYGYTRVVAASLESRVSDVKYNLKNILSALEEAKKNKAEIICFSELALTLSTCNDLFKQEALQIEALKALEVLKNTSGIISIVGLPLKINQNLYNTAFVVGNGKIYGAKGKPLLSKQEARWFTPLKEAMEVKLFDEVVICSPNPIFNLNNTNFTLEFGDELISSSYNKAYDLSSLVFVLDARYNLVTSQENIKNTLSSKSKNYRLAYVYVNSGPSESTTDFVFGAETYIYELGKLLSQGERLTLNSQMIINDVDIARINNSRYNLSFEGTKLPTIEIDFSIETSNLIRTYSKTPFIPDLNSKARFEEIIQMQSLALARRLRHINLKKTVIGLSGGLDSTLAFLIITRTNKLLNIDNSNIIAITMPGFGTSDKTYENAIKLANLYQVDLREISIKEACIQHFKDIKHDINVHDVTYENSQARERTQILMDIANKENALVVGTGDLSELALGWCTYNGDHMSMYSVNSSIPKTLVKHLVDYISKEDVDATSVLQDILNTPISPELLPTDDKGNIVQKTEDKVGPYQLSDFFLYHFITYGAQPKKLYMLACETFKDDYKKEDILRWLKIFIKRFFTQQFKRSCLPDGVKVGNVSLSPRSDFSMPSDASFDLWMSQLEEI